MRLGAQPCTVQRGTLAHRIYGKDVVAERHRHRYEVNNHYVARLEAAGFKITAKTNAENLPEMAELEGAGVPRLVAASTSSRETFLSLPVP